MVPSGSNVVQWLVDQVFNQLRRQLICSGAKPQLTMSTIPETIETSTCSPYEGMMPTSADLSHLWLAVTVLEHIGCRVLVRGQKHSLVWHLD